MSAATPVRYSLKDRKLVERIIQAIGVEMAEQGKPFHLNEHYNTIIDRFKKTMEDSPERHHLCSQKNIDMVFNEIMGAAAISFANAPATPGTPNAMAMADVTSLPISLKVSGTKRTRRGRGDVTQLEGGSKGARKAVTRQMGGLEMRLQRVTATINEANKRLAEEGALPAPEASATTATSAVALAERDAVVNERMKALTEAIAARREVMDYTALSGRASGIAFVSSGKRVSINLSTEGEDLAAELLHAMLSGGDLEPSTPPRQRRRSSAAAFPYGLSDEAQGEDLEAALRSDAGNDSDSGDEA